MSRLTLFPAFVGTVMLAVGVSSPAFAHDDIVGSTPPNGGSVEKAPAKVLIEFADQPASGGAHVTGPGSGRDLAGPTKIRGSILVIPLRSTGGAGWYTVEVTATSDDGHDIEATVEFEVLEQRPAEASPTKTTDEGEDEQVPAGPRQATAPSEDSASATGVALAAVAMIATVLGGAWWAIRRRKRRRSATAPPGQVHNPPN